MTMVPFRFKEYDENLYELLCAAEVEHQLDSTKRTANAKSAAARGNAAMVQVYKDLRVSLITNGCAAYVQGKYCPPGLEVVSGGRRKASDYMYGGL